MVELPPRSPASPQRPPISSLHASRRAFLAAGGWTAGSVAAGAIAGPPHRRDDPADMAAAARLSDLEFGVDELAQATKRLAAQRADYRALRRQPIAFDWAPSAVFSPLPPDAPPPTPGPGMRWEPPAEPPPAPRDDLELAFAPVWQLAAWLHHRVVTSRQLTELCLSRLQRFDGDLHCVITLLADEALRAADARDAERAAGTVRSPLHGIPFGAKDLFAWPSAPTTFGAAPFRDRVWNLRATVLDRLEQRGAVLVAKLSLGALAMGDLWYGGRTRNPWNPEQGSSGSSAGSACATAAGLVPFALGTETLGSIVSPCRQCGVGGLRPTFGAVSRHGAMPLSWTMDKVGPIARSAVDLGLVFDAIRGADGRDPAARDAAFPFDAKVGPGQDLEGLRIGVLANDSLRWRDSDRAFLAWLEERCGAPRPIALPEAEYSAILLMLHAEAAAAFDELLRQGRLGELPGQDDGDWPNQFRCARTIPAVEYVQASRLRARLVRDVHALLRSVDVLVAPTHGGPTLACTNLTGHPTCVLPVGAGDRDGGRPHVLALVGGVFGEAPLLRVAAAWQRVTDWHLRRPQLTAGSDQNRK